MALGPRLDLRQTPSLVMTPQLRQAIQLLQFSNIEAARFIEEELLQNPLLAAAESGAAPPESGLDAVAEPPAPPATASADIPDTAQLITSATLPDSLDTPLDLDPANSYDAGSIADGNIPFGQADSSTAGEDGWSIIDSLSDRKPGLREHLEQQARLAFSSPADLAVAAALIAALDEAGRLAEPVEAIAGTLGLPAGKVEMLRRRMLHFDPTGVFALDLRECLEAQLAEKNRLDPAMAALLANLHLLARRDMRALMEVCGVDLEDLAGMIAEIKRLNPKPAAQYETEPLRPLIPDVLMRPLPVTPEQPECLEWLLEINPETLPKLLIRRGFYARIATSVPRETRSYLNERMQSANWLVKALESRAQTILRVCAEIVRRQDAFFRHGVSHLRPLTLRDIAVAVELHESTVSRVTSNKSIATPRGIFELKFFFTTALAGANGETHSAEAVRHRVQALINGEKGMILSDDALARILQKEGIDIARRTVAKYREALRIPGSAQRKREKLSAA